MARVQLMLLLASVLLLGNGLTDAIPKCPKPCTCKQNYEKIYCNHKQLINIPSDIPPTAKQLYLDHNKITELTKDVFSSLGSLVILNLEVNDIENVESLAFNGLNNLTTLFLSSNIISDLKPQVFSGLKRLQKLFLVENKLTKLPPVGLCTALKTLSLEGNQIANAAVPAGYSSLTHLTSITLSKNKLSDLKDGDFVALKDIQLRKILLSNNKISSIGNNTFASLRSLASLKLAFNPLTTEELKHALRPLANSKLTSLNIAGLKFGKTFPTTVFQDFKGVPLQTLIMTHNAIGVILDNTFINFPTLKLLDLGYCHMDITQPNAFHGLEHLRELRLAYNKLSIFPPSLPSSLTTLDLSHNAIEALKDDDMQSLKHLKKLRIHNNRILSVSSGAFTGAQKLEYLDLGYNMMASITPLQLPNLATLILKKNNLKRIVKAPRLFHETISLKTLDLSDNDCSMFPFKALWPLKSLKTLMAQNNNFGSVFNRDMYSNLFKKANTLEYLDLKRNNIQVIPSRMFRNLTSLKEMHLEDNLIYHWEPNEFQNMKNLKFLNIAMNMVSLINKTSLVGLENLNILNLTNLPFACTCDLVWFRKWIDSTNVTLANLKQYVCHSPPKWEGVRLLKFDPSKIDCRPLFERIQFYLIGASAFVLLILMVVTGIMYRYRWYVKLRLYKIRRYFSKDRRVGYAPVEPADIEFDAYISSAPEDEDWVREVLVQPLQNPNEIDDSNAVNVAQLRLCGTYDEAPNVSRLENLCYALEHSSKVVVVLSKDYLSDRFCEFALDQIQMLSIERDENMIIIVMKGDIPITSRKIPKCLHQKLKDGDYVHYTEDPNGNLLFWDTLREKIEGAVQPLVGE